MFALLCCFQLVDCLVLYLYWESVCAIPTPTDFKTLQKFFRHNYSFILETYIAPFQETATQRRFQPSQGQRRRTSERCKLWKGGPSARNAAQRGDHSLLMDPQQKWPFAA